MAAYRGSSVACCALLLLLALVAPACEAAKYDGKAEVSAMMSKLLKSNFKAMWLSLNNSGLAGQIADVLSVQTFTIFAFTDKAYSSLPQRVKDAIDARNIFTEIVLMHIVSGKRTFDHLKAQAKGHEWVTAAGKGTVKLEKTSGAGSSPVKLMPKGGGSKAQIVSPDFFLGKRLSVQGIDALLIKSRQTASSEPVDVKGSLTAIRGDQE